MLTLAVGIAVGATATFLGQRIAATPEFWHNPVKVSEIQFVSPTTSVFKTQQAKELAFSMSKGGRCYILDDQSNSFARVDSKDGTALETFVVCPGQGAGWVKQF